MNILVYTIANWNTIGGGRRVSLELVKNFLRLGHTCFTWSIYPYNPEKYYAGQYSFPTFSFLPEPNSSIDLKQIDARIEIAGHFQDFLEARQVDFILFDNEFSTKEFFTTIWDHLKPKSSVPIMAGMIHDQRWINNPDALVIGSFNPKAKSVRKQLTCYKVKNFQSDLCENLQRQLNPDLIIPRQSGIKNTWVWRKLHQARRNFRERNDIISFKEILRHLDFTVHQTPKAAFESAVALGWEPHRSISALGVFADDENTQLSSRNFRAESDAQEKAVVLAFSRMAPEKSIETIIATFAKAVQLKPDIVLWIAGQVVENQQAYFNFIKQVVAHFKLQDKVFFWGQLSDNDMAAIYQQADSFICLQANDITIAAYTALRLGKPIVVSGCYSFPDKVDNSGLVLRQGDTLHDYAQCVVASFSMKDCQKDSYYKSIKSYLDSINYKNYASIIAEAAEHYIGKPNFREK